VIFRDISASNLKKGDIPRSVETPGLGEIQGWVNGMFVNSYNSYVRVILPRHFVELCSQLVALKGPFYSEHVLCYIRY
jgi:hypothetical protein